MKLKITEQSGNPVLIKEKEYTVIINDFDVGLRKLLQASQSVTVSGAQALENTDAELIYLDPGGSDIDVTLPAEAGNNHGFVIINTADADETITVKDDSDNVIGYIYQGGVGIYVSNGTVWKLASGDNRAIHDNVAGEINAITSKADADNNDVLVIEDSADSYAKKKILVTALPTVAYPRQASYTWNQAITTVAIDTLDLGTMWLGGAWRNTAANANDGDTYYFYPLLDSGTYKIQIIYTKSDNQGILDTYVDGVEVNSGLDMYRASALHDNVANITGVNITSAGRHELKIVVDGKNASSSDYVVKIAHISITRTGDAT
jgi:hypothetical protein